MSRSTSPFLLATTLCCGVVIGLILGRGGPSLSAQATGQPPKLAIATRTSEPAKALSGSEEAIYDQLARQYSQFEQVNRTFEMVARAVSPAVVHIVATKTGRVDESSKLRRYEETGSGVIVHGESGKNLFVLTNNHVIEGATPEKISIFLHDGRAIRPDRVWLDAAADIAVLNLGRDDLPAARLGNSEETTVGSWVLALGSPFGLTHSVSQGIISARGRHMDELHDVENQDFLQTDAAINPGNSGGPLVNMKGEVIGINNSIASNGGGSEGVGFSIPINLARWIMNQLISKGHVSRGALGIDLHPVFKPEEAVTKGLDRPRGAYVETVHVGSPAAICGLKGGDVILRYRGVEVSDLNHLINMVSMTPIGDAVDLDVWRDRQSIKLRVTVGDRDRTIAATAPVPARTTPPRDEADATRGFLRRPERPAAPAPAGSGVSSGLDLQTIDEAKANLLRLPRALHGALVVKVAPENPLASVLKPLDVVYSINGRDIHNADEARRALRDLNDAQGLLLGYDRVVNGAIERRTVRLP